jgi:hypothetical protein
VHYRPCGANFILGDPPVGLGEVTHYLKKCRDEIAGQALATAIADTGNSAGKAAIELMSEYQPEQRKQRSPGGQPGKRSYDFSPIWHSKLPSPVSEVDDQC